MKCYNTKCPNDATLGTNYCPQHQFKPGTGQDVTDLVDYLNQIPPEARANMVREYLFDAWNEGLDFARSAKPDTSRSEAIQQNPYLKPTPHELEQQRLAAANPYRTPR